MRRIFIVFALSLSLLAACSGNESESTPEELELAAATGRKAAEEALVLPAGSMEREDAIFAIRAKETELRMAGFEACADTFAAEAGKIIMAAM